MEERVARIFAGALLETGKNITKRENQQQQQKKNYGGKVKEREEFSDRGPEQAANYAKLTPRGGKD